MMKGIYQLEGDELQYCFSQPGNERPKAFKVPANSKRTLVRLERFSTGEEDIENKLASVGAQTVKDEIGWITKLTIADSPRADVALELAGGLKKLQSVIVRNSEVSKQGLWHLSRMNDLRGFGITSDSNPIEGLSALVGRRLLHSVSLSGAAITDDVLEQVQELTQVRRLSLHNTSVSSRGLQALVATLPSLTRINVTGPTLTDEGLEPRWQFGLRQLFAITTIVAAVTGGLAVLHRMAGN